MRSKMLVKDVMSSPVITIDEDAPVNRAATLMDKHDLGSVVVIDKKGKPLGILTERDLVARVLAKNVTPASIKAKEAMTSPLITIEPDASINEAAKRMRKLNVRRLGVVYKGLLAGLLSSKDILGVVPELLETIQERARIEGQNMVEEAPEETEKEEKAGEEEVAPLAGNCDKCGVWSDDLQDVNGEYLCEDCRAELGSEE